MTLEDDVQKKWKDAEVLGQREHDAIRKAVEEEDDEEKRPRSPAYEWSEDMVFLSDLAHYRAGIEALHESVVLIARAVDELRAGGNTRAT